MTIIVLAALPAELDGVLRRFRPQPLFRRKNFAIYSISIGDHRLLFALSGVGAAAVRRFFHHLAEAGLTADMVISTGYAGALRPDLPVGAVVAPRAIVFPADGHCEHAAPLPSGWTSEFLGGWADDLVTRPQKEELRARFPEMATIDMESGVVLQCCRERGVAAAVLRVVSDGPAFRFPSREWLHCAWRRPRWSTLVTLAVRHPLEFIRVVHLRRNLHIADRALARRLAELLSLLLPRPESGA